MTLNTNKLSCEYIYPLIDDNITNNTVDILKVMLNIMIDRWHCLVTKYPGEEKIPKCFYILACKVFSD